MTNTSHRLQSGRVRTAFFGRTLTPLSLLGLEVLLEFPELEITSVTCGRRNATHTEDGPLHERARAAGIPLLTFREVKRKLPAPDLVVSFSNPVIFPRRFLDSVRFGVVNMHPAPLPTYRGCHGIEHAILNRDDRFGATLHFCDPDIDSGPIIDHSWTEIRPDDVATDVWNRIDDLAVDLLRRNVPRIIAAALRDERVPTVPQSPALARYYDHYSLPEEAEVDPAWPLDEIGRWVKAYQHPRRALAYLRCGDRKVRLRFRAGEVVIDDRTRRHGQERPAPGHAGSSTCIGGEPQAQVRLRFPDAPVSTGEDLPMKPRTEIADMTLIRELEDCCLRVATLHTALEIGLFDAIADGAGMIEDIADVSGCHSRPLAVVLDALTAQGFLDKTDESYRLTPVTMTYLARSSASYYGRSCRDLTLSGDIAMRLTETVRSGRSSPPPSAGGGDLWAADFAPSLTLWPLEAAEARTMWRRLTAEHPLPQGTRILDVACGAGVDTLALLQDDPLARATAMDLHPEVLETTREIARRMGVEERVELRTGDVLTSDFGRAAYDVILFSSILYFFDRGRVVDVFRRAHAALQDGGVLLVHHLQPDEERRSRLAPALLAVQLLLFHPRSRVYSAFEYSEMLAEAGFPSARALAEDLLFAIRRS